MKKFLQLLKQDNGPARFLRFCITGGLNTGVDFAIYTVLTTLLAMDLYLAQVISYSAGILNSYCINRKWTFRTRSRFFSQEMVRFITVNLIVMALSIVVMKYLNEQLHWYFLFSKLATVVFTMVLGFILNRLLVFRRSKEEVPTEEV